jgi:hypothetical protein
MDKAPTSRLARGQGPGAQTKRPFRHFDLAHNNPQAHILFRDACISARVAPSSEGRGRVLRADLPRAAETG